jgi:hypothetical protein
MILLLFSFGFCVFIFGLGYLFCLSKTVAVVANALPDAVLRPYRSAI